MSNNNRVVKFRRRKNINIGIIVFLIMFLYIAINVYIYLTKNHLTIYEVKEGSTASDKLITGLILRDEDVVNSNKAGYVSYFQKEGARVSKNASIYSVNDNQQMLDVITNGNDPITLTKADDAEIKYKIQSFQKNFTDDNFITVYDFLDDAQSTVLDLLNQSMIEQGQKIQDETGYTYSYDIQKSQKSGIISYYTDSFESVTADNITADMFQKDKYKRTSLRTTEMIEKNSPVYKLIKSEKWSIILPLATDQYKKLKKKETVNFTIKKDDFNATAKISFFKKGSDNFAELSMDKLLSNYLEDRYLDIELDMDSVDGLKIPVSSIVEKEFYRVPLKYFTKGANSDSDGLTAESYDKKSGDVTYTFVPADIYYKDDTYGYVDTKLFSKGTIVRLADSDDQYELNKTAKLTGVYNVNAGYAVFKRIEILYQNDDDEYCIIKKDTSNGLSAYDHIALNGKMAVEQKIIY